MITQIDKKGIQTGKNHSWLDVLEEYNIKYMALDPLHDGKLIEQLQTRPNWIVEYANEEAIFFVYKDVPIHKRTHDE
jgi:hypothetical protein